jgi:hypothetical protein
MCNFNPNCTQSPGVVVTVGPGKSMLDCCGVVVDAVPPTTESKNRTASP